MAAPPTNRATSHDCQTGQAQLGSNGGVGNLVFSPLSIHAALALVAAGARGRTLDELLALRPLKPAYRDAVVEYKATVSTADFRNKPVEAIGKINAWVADVTNNLITNLVGQDDINPNTVLVLANAIYFKGKWEDPFDDKYTKEKKFHLHDGISHVTVPFMRTWSDRMIACHDGFKVLKLPYKDDEYYKNPDVPRFSMCIFLPTARNGLPKLVKKIASDEGFLLRHLPVAYVEVGEFFVPKFKLSFYRSVVGVLKELGMQLPFDPWNADLKDMVEEENVDFWVKGNVFVDRVIHNEVVEVSEEGSEAAAVTTVLNMDIGCGPNDYVPPPRKLVDFVADHPFAFFIVEEKSRAIVFAGQVLDLSKE
uniref:Serpin domain-containing protein n=1 Tax=Leersia perrieri TaxID=77586 RepID=A0A0D9XQK0_9ORYZ